MVCVRLSELVDSDLTKKSVLGETDLTRKSVLGETDFSELVNSEWSQCGQAACHIPEGIGHKFLSICLPNQCIINLSVLSKTDFEMEITFD